MTASDIELAINRSNTQRYINMDPVDIALKFKTISFVNGTRIAVPDSTRDSQTFKVIWTGNLTGIITTPDKQVRRFDFILVGTYDSIVAIDDYWLIDNQQNNIDYIYPSNGYEVKCGGTSQGDKPSA